MADVYIVSVNHALHYERHVYVQLICRLLLGRVITSPRYVFPPFSE